MNYKQIENELEEIEEEWNKHRVMNTCSICDSPKGHTTIKAFLKAKINQVIDEMIDRPEDLGGRMNDAGFNLLDSIKVAEVVFDWLKEFKKEFNK